MARCSASVAPVAAKFVRASASGIAVERACILSPGPLLGADAFFGEGLDAGANPPPPPSRPLAAYLMDCERDYLRMVLEQHGGHMTHTAETLGITRKTLWEKMRRLGLQAREDL